MVGYVNCRVCLVFLLLFCVGSFFLFVCLFVGVWVCCVFLGGHYLLKVATASLFLRGHRYQPVLLSLRGDGHMSQEGRPNAVAQHGTEPGPDGRRPHPTMASSAHCIRETKAYVRLKTNASPAF